MRFKIENTENYFNVPSPLLFIKIFLKGRNETPICLLNTSSVLTYLGSLKLYIAVLPA